MQVSNFSGWSILRCMTRELDDAYTYKGLMIVDCNHKLYGLTKGDENLYQNYKKQIKLTTK